MRDAVVEGISQERAALLAALAHAGGDDWSRETVCTGWSVKDVLAHTVEGELNVGKVYRGELRESGFIDPNDGIAKWAALPGEAVRAALWQHGTATQRALEAMTEHTWRAPIKVFGCREIRHLARLHLFDLSVHGHDLTEALGVSAVWTDRLAFLTEFVVRAAPSTLRRLKVSPAGALEVRCDGRSWVLDGRSGEWTLGQEPAGTSVSLEPEDLVLLTTGRRARGDVHAVIDGDPEPAERILRAWRVV